MTLLKNRWLVYLSSFVLGGVFVAASYHKLEDPPSMAKIVLNYKLLPCQLIDIVAIYMPWMEALAGLAVIIGLGRRGGALGLGLLCLVFIGALGYNLAVGHPTICGCFNTYEESIKMTEPELFWQMKREILIDLGLFLLASQILFGMSSP